MASALVVIMIGRSFLARSSPALLMLGCGALIWGLAGTIVPLLLAHGINTVVTVHNSLLWVAAVCHLLAGLFFRLPNRTLRWPGLALGLA